MQRRLLSLSVVLCGLALMPMLMAKAAPASSSSSYDLRQILMEEARVKERQLQQQSPRYKRAIDDDELYDLFIDYFENDAGLALTKSRSKRSIHGGSGGSEIDLTQPIEIDFPDSSNNEAPKASLVKEEADENQPTLTKEEIRELTKKSDLAQILKWLDALAHGREHDVTAALVMAKKKSKHRTAHSKVRQEAVATRLAADTDNGTDGLKPPGPTQPNSAPLAPQPFYMQYFPRPFEFNFQGYPSMSQQQAMNPIKVKEINRKQQQQQQPGKPVGGSEVVGAQGIDLGQGIGSGQNRKAFGGPNITDDIGFTTQTTNSTVMTTTTPPTTSTTTMTSTTTSTSTTTTTTLRPLPRNSKSHVSSEESAEKSSKDHTLEEEQIKMKKRNHDHSEKAHQKKHHSL